MKHEMSCGCTYDPDDQKDGYENVIMLNGECRKVIALWHYSAGEGKIPARDSDLSKKYRLIDTQHRCDIDAHPEWKF